MRWIAGVAFACAAIATARVCLADGVPAKDTAERAYVRAVDAMRALASPPYATYTATWHSSGLGFDFEQEDGRIQIAVGYGRSFVNDRTFTAAYRGSDRALQYATDSQRLIGRQRLLEPTWAGAYEILRYGLHGPIARTVPAPDASPTAPAPFASPGEQLADIASVSAISALYYRVEDDGTRPCAGVGFGRALHLIARKSVRTHPLTDVVLDPETGRFCSMTFVVKESGMAGITGHYTIDFAPYGSYWLVSHGAIAIDVRLLGIAAKHATIDWEIGAVTTPDSLPDATFDVAP